MKIFSIIFPLSLISMLLGTAVSVYALQGESRPAFEESLLSPSFAARVSD